MTDTEPEFLPEDGDPGVRKTFWAHLQDLRTAVVRSAIAVGAALMVAVEKASTKGWRAALMKAPSGTRARVSAEPSTKTTNRA